MGFIRSGRTRRSLADTHPMIISWLLVLMLQEDPLILGVLGDFPTQEACGKAAGRVVSEHKVGCMALGHEGI